MPCGCGEKTEPDVVNAPLASLMGGGLEEQM